MSESMRMWIEISFNISYLIAVWILVALMFRRRNVVAPDDRLLATRVMQAFALLALGDTGHVGFRVWAYALGRLDSTLTLGGVTIPLVGAGALATAVTVTLFYMLMLDAWRLRFKKCLGWFGYTLLAAGVIRLAIMLLPANEWSRVEPPQPWGTYRNIPLMIQGLGLAYVVLRDALAKSDRTFVWIGISILVSYACYAPVVFFVQQVPMLGMLMIPKTLAYLAIAIFAYRELYGAEPNAARASA